MSPKTRRQRAKWTDENPVEMDLDGREKDESEVVVWPSNRNRIIQESQVSSEWIKWHSKREEGLTAVQDQLDDPTPRLIETHRTEVGQKARTYLK